MLDSFHDTATAADNFSLLRRPFGCLCIVAHGARWLEIGGFLAWGVFLACLVIAFNGRLSVIGVFNAIARAYKPATKAKK